MSAVELAEIRDRDSEKFADILFKGKTVLSLAPDLAVGGNVAKGGEFRFYPFRTNRLHGASDAFSAVDDVVDGNAFLFAVEGGI